MQPDLLKARVIDTAAAAEKGGAPAFLGFLTPAQAAEAVSVLGGCRYELFGGFDGAERTYLCCKPDWCEDACFPITALSFSFRKCDTLSHRDFLGSLMALGITRESVGDILVESGRAVVFVSSSVAGFVKTQIGKIGRVGVQITDGFVEPLPQLGQCVEVGGTVASTRIDCVVAEIAGLSRTGAAAAVNDGLVSVNSVLCEKVTRPISEGDKITIRGRGRFTVTSLSGVSKKGRIILKYTKFI